MLKAVLFDMDGVIIDSEPIHRKVSEKIFKELSIQMDEEEHSNYVGVTSRYMWSKVKQNYNLDCSIDELLKNEVDTYIKYLLSHDDIKPVNGVVDVMQELYNQNIKIALASSAVRISADTVIGMFKLQKYFQTVVSGEDVENGKPAPDIFLCAANNLKVAPNECVVIEDSRNGVEAAKLAGMKCVGYKNLNSGNQDLSKADLIVDSFEDINYKRLCELFSQQTEIGTNC